MQGDGANFQASLTITPSSKLDSSTTYIGFHVLAKNSTKTMSSLEAAFKSKPEAQVNHQNWNGQDWLLVEYPGKNAQNQPAIQWLAFTSKGGSKYLVAAGAPTTQEKQKIISVLSSAKLR